MGDLHLQDGLFGYDDLNLLLSDEEVKKTFSQDARMSVYLSARLCDNNRSWKVLEKVANANITIHSLLRTKPETESSFSNEFCSNLKRFYNEKPARNFIDGSNHQGTLKITKPVLYIFPAREGDSAFFTINGYSILINGGYDRVRPCFWKFVNVLQQLDSVLITHNDSDALGGLSTFFSKKMSDNQLRPTVLTVLGNLVNEIKPNNAATTAAVNAIANEISSSSLASETLSDTELILDAINKLNVKLIPLVKNNVSTPLSSQSLLSQNKYEHINLYYKLGQGSLDLYVLSPFATSSEYKEFVQQQQNHLAKNIKHHKSQLEVNQLFRNIPLTHLNSAVVLMVWLPFNAHNAHNAHQHRNSITNSSENCALRFLFTGNAPQNVIFHALEKIKDFDVISTPVYKAKSLETGSSILNPPPSSVAPVPSTNAPTSSSSKKTSLLPSEISKDVNAKSSDSKPTNTRTSLQFPTNRTNDANKEKTVKETAAKSTDKDSSKPPVSSSTSQPKKPVEVKKKAEEKPTAPPKPEKEAKKPPQPTTQSSKPASQKTLEIKLGTEAKPNSALKTTASATTAKSTDATKPAASKPATLLATKPANNKSPSTNSQAKDAVFSKKKDDKTTKKEKEPAEPKSNIITKRNAKPATPSTEVVAAPVVASSVATTSAEDVKVEVKEEQAIVPEDVTKQSEQQDVEVTTVVEKVEESRNCENLMHTSENFNEESNIINVKQDDLVINNDNYNHNEQEVVEFVHQEPLQQQNDVQELVEEQTTTTTTEQLVVEEIVEESMTKNQSLPTENVASQLEENVNSNREDIMTNSFIEDPSNPQSNPFLSSEPVVSGSESAHTIDSTSGAAVSSSNHPEELDPNRYVQNGYHQDEDYHHNHTNGNGYHTNGNGYHTNGNGNGHHHHNDEEDEEDENTDAKFISESKQMIKNNGIDLMADTLSSELGTLNINESQQVKSNDPTTWTPLELPKPIDPTTLNTSASEKTNGNKKAPASAAPVTSSPLADSSNKLKKLAATNGANGNQTKPLAKVQHPVYLEVCYIPTHGNGHYSDMEFFRRVRSRHYILSTQEPNEDMLNALIKAKETWEEKSLQVSIIPTYESDVLRRWFVQNEEKLAKLKIDVHPAANLATLSMDDLPDMTCQVYKLEF